MLGASGGFLVQAASLGTSAGSTLKGYAAAVSDTNNDTLQTSAVRLTAGSDWTTAAWRLARVVDGTAVSTSLDFLQAGLRVNGAAGFNGAAPVGQQTVSAALATDGSASSAQLATAFNSLRTALSALGLVK